ncbi:hypothetical protein AUC43_15430 [Hymenobacter sedentarius]|uniref:Uncharacterized protein n=1 Tax=Hymenobacter sedentarius TaxID=1411621 RepID=A0A0U3T0I2_9BACT|nr:hypothetical protein [Hymenobacter sedentarius]ALW86355.1 hypothetical protein AUC43_15430 [Hymenobacter sedentarius]
MSSITTLKAFLQDEIIQEEYGITEADVAGASMTGSTHESNMMIVLLREMVNQHTDRKPSKSIATRLYTVLTSRL